MKTFALFGGICFLMLAGDASALVRCGVTKDNRAFDACEYRVPDTVFTENGPAQGGIEDQLPPNYAFAAAFDVYTCWDMEDDPPPEYWGPVELREFANEVLRGDPADADGLALAILDFFAANTPPQGMPIGIAHSGGIWSQFEIHVQAGATEIGAADNKLSVDIITYAQGIEAPSDVAHAGFTHEWQHVCEAWYKRDGFTESDFPGTSMRFGEICSVLSEWLFGLDGSVGIGGFEIAYDQSPVSYLESGGQTYHAQCLCDEDLSHCCPYHDVHPYVQYSLFGAYLHNRLPFIGQGSGSFFQSWLHKLDGTTYLHDLRGLSELLEDTACDGLFPGISAGNDRLKELVHRWEAAKFLNWTGGSGPDDLLQWQHASVPGTPQDNYNLFRPQDGGDCWNDIEAAPPYHVLGSGQVVSHEGFLKYSDLFGAGQGCDALGAEGEYLHHRRFVEVSSFAANYIVLFPTSGSTAELVFSPSVNYACADCAHESQPEALFHALKGPLEVDITPYGLSGLPAWAFNPIDGPYLDEAVNLPGTSVFKLPGIRIADVQLGRDYGVSVDLTENVLDAVVFVISCVDRVCDDGTMIAEFVPYSYSLCVDPGRVLLSPSIEGLCEIGPGQTRWIAGPVTVGASGSLVLKEGAKLFAESENAYIAVNGALLLDGAAGATCRIAASPYPEDGVSSWAGVSVASGGALAGEHAALSGLNALDLSSMAGTSTLDNCALTFDGGGNARLSTPRGGAITISACSITNLNHIEMRGGIIANSALRQREAVLPLVLPEPFLRIAADQQAVSATISGSSIQAVDNPIRVGGSSLLTSVSLTERDNLALYDSGLASKRIGLWVRSNSNVLADALLMDLNPPPEARFKWGVRVEGNGSLLMRGSTIVAYSECISTSSGSSSLDLGRDVEGQYGENKLLPPIEVTDYCHKECWDHDNAEGTPDVCLEHVVGSPGRVIYNRSANNVLAQRNHLPKGLNPPDIDESQVCFGRYVRSTVPGTEVLVFPRSSPGQEACPGGPSGCEGAFTVIGGSAPAEAVRPIVSLRNPSVGGILLRAEATEQGQGGSLSIVVYDIAGRRVVERSVAFADGRLRTGGVLIRPDRRALPSGVYLVRVFWDGGAFTQKTVVVK